MNFKILLVLCSLVLVTGCATQRPILQIDGQPISDKIIYVNLLGLEGLKVKYQLSRNFKVLEGKEYYESREYLSFTNELIYKLGTEDELSVDVIIFNPLKKQFKLVQYLNTKGGAKLETREYEGSLSRNKLTIKLPIVNEESEWFFRVFNEQDVKQYESFKVYYRYDNKG